MKGLVKTRPGSGLWLTEVPDPEPGPNDVVIDVSFTSICGTDLHIYDWDEWAAETVPIGMVVGHEFSGVVARVGSAVVDVEVGQRVTGEGHLTCGHCRNCRAGRRHLCPNTLGIGVDRSGAFAEQIVIHSRDRRFQDCIMLQQHIFNLFRCDSVRSTLDHLRLSPMEIKKAFVIDRR